MGAAQRGLITAVALLLNVLTHDPAHAQQPLALAALVVTSTDDGCMTRGPLAASVEARLGRRVFVDPKAADMLVEVHIRQQNTSWNGKITLRSAQGAWLGSREIVSDAPDCASLDEPLTLVIALIVDVPKDEIPEPRTEPEQAKPARASQHSERRRVRLGRRERRSVSERHWALESTVAGVLSRGLVPGFAPGVHLSLTLFPPSFWAMDFGLTIWKQSRIERPFGEAQFAVLAADVGLCPLSGARRSVHFLGCISQSVGRITARGNGFDRNHEQNRLLYLVGLRALGTWPFGSLLSGRLGLGVDVSVTRDRFFYVDSYGQAVQLYRLAPLVGTAELGIALGFR